VADSSDPVTIDELQIADDRARWGELGFTLDGDGLRLGRVRLRLAGGAAGEGIVSWSLRGVSTTELDGLPTTRSDAPESEPAPEHPNGVIGIDHVVVFSPQLDRTVSALQAAGLGLRRIREEPTPAGAPRQAFFRLGSEILEVVQIPPRNVEAAGGPDAPARLWGLAFTVSDLDRTVTRLAGHVSAPRDAVQPGRRIATLRRSAGLAVPVALMTPRAQAADSRAGEPQPASEA
jgi:Glyoxalase-like domain